MIGSAEMRARGTPWDAGGVAFRTPHSRVALSVRSRAPWMSGQGIDRARAGGGRRLPGDAQDGGGHEDLDPDVLAADQAGGEPGPIGHCDALGHGAGIAGGEDGAQGRGTGQGGQVRGLTQAAVGPEALEALALLRVDVAVLGTNGLSAHHGLSTPDADEATVKRAMVRAARRVVALADASKIGQEHMVSFARLDDVDLLVTDAEPPHDLTDQLTTTATEVLVA